MKPIEAPNLSSRILIGSNISGIYTNYEEFIFNIYLGVFDHANLKFCEFEMSRIIYANEKRIELVLVFRSTIPTTLLSVQGLGIHPMMPLRAKVESDCWQITGVPGSAQTDLSPRRQM